MKTIIYIEDEQFKMGSVVDRFSKNYKVLRARNVEQALELIFDKKTTIDLILLDIMMAQSQTIVDPNRGRTMGLELLRHFKSHGKSIPVVCYTVVDNAEVVGALKKLGVIEVINKNQTLSYLEKVVDRILIGGEK